MEHVRKVAANVKEFFVNIAKVVAKTNYLLYRELLSKKPTATFFEKIRPQMKEMERAQVDISTHYAKPEIQKKYMEMAEMGLADMKENPETAKKLEVYLDVLGLKESEYLDWFSQKLHVLPSLLLDPARIKMQMWYHWKKWKHADEGIFSMTQESAGYVSPSYGRDKNYARINHDILDPYKVSVHELEHVVQFFLCGSEDIDKKVIKCSPYLFGFMDQIHGDMIDSVNYSSIYTSESTNFEVISNFLKSGIVDVFSLSAQEKLGYYTREIEILSRIMEIIIGYKVSKKNILTLDQLETYANASKTRHAYTEMMPYIKDKQLFVDLINKLAPNE